MYLGALGTLDADLAQVDSNLSQAQLDYTREAAYYLGYMEGTNVDPIVWGNLKAQAQQIVTMLPAWRKKFRALMAVRGQTDSAAWDRAAGELASQGTVLVTSIKVLIAALKKRQMASAIVGNLAASVGILTKVIAIEIPTIVANKAKAITKDAVTFSGEVLQIAGTAVGKTAGSIIDPIKGTLWIILGVAGLGIGAYIYTMMPKGKKA